MGVLSELKPEPVFKYFEEICGIPHTSHHEKELSDSPEKEVMNAHRMKWAMCSSSPGRHRAMKMRMP